MYQENDFANRSYEAVRRRADEASRQMTLSLFACVAVVFVAHVFWSAALAGTLIPRLVFDCPHAMALAVILGMTIGAYTFVWQSSQEVEEAHRRGPRPLRLMPRGAAPELARIRTDTATGMGISNLIAFFIILATAATLNASGVTDIQTSS